MKGKNKKARPHRKWVNDIEDRGEDTLQKLYHFAQNRDGWRRIIELTLEAYGA